MSLSKQVTQSTKLGVSAMTKASARAAGCDLVTTGDKRNRKEHTHSYQRRVKSYPNSALRIRVENMIGIVKHKFKILQNVLPIHFLGLMDKIVYVCFMLFNFGFRTID